MSLNLLRVTRKASDEEVARKLNQAGIVWVSGDYINNRTPLQVRCMFNHSSWMFRLDGSNRHGCPYCYQEKKRSSDKKVKDKLESIGLKWISGDYKNNRSVIRVMHTCGHIWNRNTISINRGAGCAKCASNASKDLSWLLSLPGKRNFICMSSKYVNKFTKYTWKCTVPKCGRIWLTTAHSIDPSIRGSGCPRCAKQQSKPETQIYEFVKQSHPDALHGLKGILKNKRFELDIWVPSLRKAIEFDGHVWHKGKFSKRDNVPARDARKNQECIDAGVLLLRICSLDFKKDPDSVFAIISKFLSGNCDI